MRQFAGCCRFVWNKALALEQEAYENSGKRNGYNKLTLYLTGWKKEEKTSFLKDAQSQILQQSLKDLDQAYINFFKGRANFPNFKKRGTHDSFRYPQGFKIDEGNCRVFLPKIGWVKYFKDRNIKGTPKNITVSQLCEHWYVSIQTEREAEEPVHPSTTSVGIDMGIVHFATLSDGSFIEPVNALKKYSRKLARLQQKLSKKNQVLQ